MFNLTLKTNETHYVSLHASCACKCRLFGSVCKDRQRSNNNICRCECKELIDGSLFGFPVQLNLNVINYVIYT